MNHVFDMLIILSHVDNKIISSNTSSVRDRCRPNVIRDIFRSDSTHNLYPINPFHHVRCHQMSYFFRNQDIWEDSTLLLCKHIIIIQLQLDCKLIIYTSADEDKPNRFLEIRADW